MPNKAQLQLPVLTVPMNRADPFFERDATAWQYVDMNTGRVTLNFQLPNNTNRQVGFDQKKGKPVDSKYQPESKRIPPQTHY